MTSLIAGTWSLISSSAEVITGARRMTVRIQRLLQIEKIEISESDKRRLLGLQKRVDCLVQPLNFLLLWSKKRDSCVQQAVLSAQELLFDVCSYVERFVPQDGCIAIASGKGGANPGCGHLDSEQLEYYLRELEFACASVSMAVSISRVVDAPPQPQMQTQVQDVSADGENSVSLSALLRASRRIQDMRGHTGDLCACSGRLYSEAVGFRRSPSPAAASGYPAAEAGGAAEASRSQASTRMPSEWAPVLSLATFKVVAAEDARRGRRRYHITVDSRLPLTQRESSPGREISSDEVQRGLNADGPLIFPIEVALEAHFATTANMVLPAEPSATAAVLGIDSLVLVWGDVSSTSDASRLAEMCSNEFPDAVLLPDSSTPVEAHGLSRPPQPSPRWSPTLGPSRPAAPVPSRFAFVFDVPRGTEPRSGDSEVALTPLDALYLARLCALDDGQLASVQDNANVDGSVGACPPHLLSSDEVLATLLKEGAPKQTSEGDGSTQEIQKRGPDLPAQRPAR